MVEKEGYTLGRDTERENRTDVQGILGEGEERGGTADE